MGRARGTCFSCPGLTAKAPAADTSSRLAASRSYNRHMSDAQTYGGDCGDLRACRAPAESARGSGHPVNSVNNAIAGPNYTLAATAFHLANQATLACIVCALTPAVPGASPNEGCSPSYVTPPATCAYPRFWKVPRESPVTPNFARPCPSLVGYI